MSRIKSSLTKHRTDLRGFTLAELMVSMAVVGVVGLVMFSVMVSTMKLSTVNTATNLSNYRTRQALDRLADTVHYDAVEIPTQINSNGTTVATGTTTSDGILIKRLLGAGYTFLNASGKTTDDIPQGASTFVVHFAPSTGALPPIQYDYFLLSSPNGDELEVNTVGSTTTSNGISSVPVSTFNSVQDTNGLATSIYSVTACRYRQEAYIFVQNGTSNYWTLRYYPQVYPGMDYTNPRYYHELGTGFQKQGTQAWFTSTTDSATNTQAIWLRALVRSSGHNEYAEHIDNRNTTTTMPLQIKLWNYNAPPTSN